MTKAVFVDIRSTCSRLAERAHTIIRSLRLNSITATVLFSGLLGALVFVHIYGFRILDITYDDWIRNATGDFAQSYYGWRFFRHSAWHWPIGLMDDVAYPSLTPIMYIDSVPIFNVIFKVLNPLLPATVQFFGIWGLLCFILNGALGGALVHRFTRNTLYSTVGSVFFALTTFSIQRLYTHTALAANWIILWCLILVVFDKGDRSRRGRIVLALQWFLMFFMAISVNMYYVPIIGIVMVMYGIYRSVSKKTALPAAYVIGGSLVGAVASFYLYGGFYHMGSTTVAAAGLGDLGANLNSLFNPMETGLYLTGWSQYLKTLPMAMPGQYEGYAYLGLGVMVYAVMAVAGLLAQRTDTLTRWWKTYHVRFWYVAATVVLLLVASFGKQMTLNSRVLLDIPYPEFFLKVYGIFRSTGRFMWGVWDILVLAFLVVAYKVFSKKVVAILLCLCCVVIQVHDLRPMTDNRHELYAQQQSAYIPRVDTAQLDSLLIGKKHVMVYSDGNLPLQVYYDIAEKIIPRDITINDFYYSRRDTGAIVSYQKEQSKQLNAGKPDGSTVYVFDTYAQARRYQSDLHLYALSGLVFGTASPVSGLDELGRIGNGTKLRIRNGAIVVPQELVGRTVAMELSGRGANTMQFAQNGVPFEDGTLLTAHDSGSLLNGVLTITAQTVTVESETDTEDVTVTVYLLE